MIEYVTIIGWLKLPTHVDVTLYYMHGTSRCMAVRTMPAGTDRTPHNEHVAITRFKQEASKEGYRHVIRKSRPLNDDRVAPKVGRGRS